MGLIDRFQRLFRPREEETQPVTLVAPPPRPSQALALFNVENSRRSVVEDCRAMYRDDPRAKGVLSTLARDALKGGFELAIEGARSDQAMDEANGVIERLDLNGALDDWIRLSLRDGDSFLELAADRNGDLVHVSRKPTLEMHRWADEFDRFYDPMRAYFWSDRLLFTGDAPPENATWFAEWQVVHARWDHDEGSRYGSPLFASARKAYKRFDDGEFNIAIRRKTRAGMKYVHRVPEANESALRRYMEMNKDAINDKYAAVADFFADAGISIDAIQGDARLSDIDDVMHHIRTWWLASPVPMAILGYGQDLNRDVLDEQEQQYQRSLERVSNWVGEQILKPIIERQWLLKGIWPAGLTWDIEWGTKDPLTPDRLEAASKALLSLRASGLFTDETLLRLFSQLAPYFDVEAELEALAGRMNDEMARIGGQVDGT